MRWRDAAQEIYELGFGRATFRVGWEVRRRAARVGKVPRRTSPKAGPGLDPLWTSHLPLEDPVSVRRAMEDRILPADLDRLRQSAEDAIHGRMLCFSRWMADFGEPIRWHQNPLTGRGWNPTAPWADALGDSSPGDIKDCWEVARFPHAYQISRAATFFPEHADRYAGALAAQIRDFTQANPYGEGIHWASGQEIGFRLLAWLFAQDSLLLRTPSGAAISPLLADALIAGAEHIERYLDFARVAVYNNHLLSESLALYGVGALMTGVPQAPRWRKLGRDILDQQAERQFYKDGAYIQQSHNYHRVALQDYMWACVFARAMGDSPSKVWLQALERSVDFLYAHQNPTDGRLPNYGANDGSLPSVLSTCDFSDMRSTLQCVSLLVRGERLYEPGPWDESPAWICGVRSLDAPLRKPPRRSVSFAETGYHVLRGKNEASFGAFRCGTLRDRFSQIDMLQLDVWWKGENVLVDSGTFRYNAADKWHEHFMRTASHNTVVVDGDDQMLHHRQFKVLYWTKATLLRFADDGPIALCEGEHYGYKRERNATHRRTVLFLKDDLWVVIDRVLGSGSHQARLHWLAGPYDCEPVSGGITLAPPPGPFSLRVFKKDGAPAAVRVGRGQEDPPAGWLSRYYGERVAVPFVAVEDQGTLPLTFVTVAGAGTPTVTLNGTRWSIKSEAHGVLSFILDGDEAAIRNLTIDGAPVSF